MVAAGCRTAALVKAASIERRNHQAYSESEARIGREH